MTSGTLCRRDSPQSRSSLHSSSSGGSTSLTSEAPVNVPQMFSQGVPEAEILALWLDGLGFPGFTSLFLTQGYDLPTIARITPEDLTALGVKEPAQRQLLHSEIRQWGLNDSWPSVVPSGNVAEWLMLIGLSEYAGLFESQGYNSLNEVQKLTWEDFLEIGIKKLGHLKRLELAIKKMKVYPSHRSSLPSQAFDSCDGCFKTKFSEDADTLSYMGTMPRLNLHSPSKILSEATFADSDHDKYSQENACDDSSACPPPPGKLFLAIS
ncbi:unnamed protein product [Enterobius vermicularis]|uniref:SAM domain-containing protein n=1 Tax=Enterobius vermicularis TaxID=51028 RepID=A0A0N4UZ33_ENTVE|nr:unnamed protein product [Enterobius vermicularis]